jgi:aspartyl-tRNA(Asn)/glutamyl-tRNA(Gln) amidotransferase subunit B
MARLAAQYGLPPYDAAVLTEQRELADYYEACAREVDGKLASNWLMTEVLRVLKERGWTLAEWSERVPPGRLVELLKKVASKELPGPLAKQLFGWMVEEPGGAGELLERHGVRVQATADELRPLVRAVLAENPGPVRQYLGGKSRTLGFLVGQVMKKSGGQAAPQVVQELLREEIEGARRGS